MLGSFLMRSTGREVTMLRSAAKTLATSGSLEEHCAQPWAEAEKAQQLSCSISPQRDPQAFAAPGGAALHCRHRSWDVFGKCTRTRMGAKQAGIFPSGLLRSYKGLFIYLFIYPPSCLSLSDFFSVLYCPVFQYVQS